MKVKELLAVILVIVIAICLWLILPIWGLYSFFSLSLYSSWIIPLTIKLKWPALGLAGLAIFFFRKDTHIGASMGIVSLSLLALIWFVPYWAVQKLEFEATDTLWTCEFIDDMDLPEPTRYSRAVNCCLGLHSLHFD